MKCIYAGFFLYSRDIVSDSKVAKTLIDPMRRAISSYVKD
jgi:hypothetical protein